MLDEVIITRAIIEAYFKKLTDHLELDVAIVGGGPSGLVAGYDLARAGKKTALFESKLSIGGGVWGGGMGFNEISGAVSSQGRSGTQWEGCASEPDRRPRSPSRCLLTETTGAINTQPRSGPGIGYRTGRLHWVRSVVQDRFKGTPAEHLRLPTVRDVREGVVASRIAAHAADVARGQPSAIAREKAMAQARKTLDWDAQMALSIDPEKARHVRGESEIGTEAVCTMCGDFCAIKRINERKATPSG